MRSRGLRRVCLFSLSAVSVLCSAALVHAAPAATNVTLISVDSGSVRGVVANGVIAFKGIPYAEPPVGNLRWRMPRSARAWPGVLDASRFGPSCMQPGVPNVSEDCLTLNVWRPAAPSARPLPVMVWIHGGALVRGGASTYPGDALAAQGVIVVSMNYRLGRLGFFAHPALAAEAPGDLLGNYGYMDQVAALRWVKRNIEKFGGDPHAVTIFGEAAGGGSVLVHLTSPLSRGLFQRAILESPVAPGPRAGVIPITELGLAEGMAIAYAQSLGIQDKGEDALTVLRAVPAAKLTEGASAPEVLEALARGALVPGFAMAIRDGDLITGAPEAILAAHKQAMVPTIAGATDRDLALGVANTKDELFAIFGPGAPAARNIYDPHGGQTLDELKQQVFADRLMLEPARHFANEMAHAGQPTWLYRFTYVAESERGSAPGAGHGIEIPYVFDLPAADKAMAATASAYWVAFAKTGNPNGGNRPQWPRHDPNVNRILTFTNAGVTVGPDPLKPRLDLWRQYWQMQLESTSADRSADRKANRKSVKR